ncbi:hypothetical protein [Bacteroides xylanisolvens]|uniref:hypothetical protein n=1 Tax=Bacteroides xylanisolvens TaxID=371601 RepID=UPI001898DC79|nr:hypothetical protein [Bacteroides xylanisolvens]
MNGYNPIRKQTTGQPTTQTTTMTATGSERLQSYNEPYSLITARPTPAEPGKRHHTQSDPRSNTAHNCQPASNLL